jgi:hypothetical protein
MTTPTPPGRRNLLIDLARVGSVAVVVVFHTLLWQLRWSPEAGIAVVPWAPGPVWWFLSWFLAIIPVFFVAAGFANAVVVDSARARGTGYPRFLLERGTRLTGPLTLFGAFFVLASSVPAWAGMLDAAVSLSRQFAQLLWFLVVYLVLLLASPALVAAFDRWGWLSLLPLAVGAVAVDVVARQPGLDGLQWLNLFLAWPLAHQWGIAYHRGWFRGWPAPAGWAGVAAAAAGIAVLVFGLGYPPAAVAWADVLVANLQPPTVAALVMGFGQACLLGLAQRAGVFAEPGERGRTLLVALNALLFTVYLWHIPVFVRAGGRLAGATLLWPAAAGLLLQPLLWLVLVLAGLAALVPLVARLEWRLIPRVAPEAGSPAVTVAGFAVLLAGTTAVWLSGAVVHPGAPASSVAVALLVTGLVWVRIAAGQRPSG